MDDNPERRSWPAIAATVAAWALAVLLVCALAGIATGSASPPLLAAAAAGASGVAVAGLSNVFVCWCAGYAVGRRYEEILLVGGSREETEALAERLVGRLTTGRRRWSVIRAAGDAAGEPGASAALRAPATFSSFGERVTLTAGEGWVHIASESAVRLQTLDWGKNHRNVERVRNTLERVSGRPARPA